MYSSARDEKSTVDPALKHDRHDDEDLYLLFFLWKRKLISYSRISNGQSLNVGGEFNLVHKFQLPTVKEIRNPNTPVVSVRKIRWPGNVKQMEEYYFLVGKGIKEIILLCLNCFHTCYCIMFGMVSIPTKFWILERKTFSSNIFHSTFPLPIIYLASKHIT